MPNDKQDKQDKQDKKDKPDNSSVKKRLEALEAQVKFLAKTIAEMSTSGARPPANRDWQSIRICRSIAHEGYVPGEEDA